MRKLLTIGETAGILNISTSRIRFYEKEGLVEPARIDANGYRLYDFQQIDLLEGIKLFADLGLPLKEIKEIFCESGGYDYRAIMERALMKIEGRMALLRKKKEFVQHNLLQHSSFVDRKCVLQPEKERWIYVLEESFTDLSIRDVYGFINKHNLDYFDYQNEIYLLQTGDGLPMLGLHDTLKKKKLPGVRKIVLPAGEYLSMTAKAENYEKAFSVFDELFAEAAARGLKTGGTGLFIDDMNRLFYSRDDMHLTFQVRVDS